MTAKEIDKLVQKIKDKTKESLESKEKSQEALVKSGIYTKKGNLRKPFNGRM